MHFDSRCALASALAFHLLEDDTEPTAMSSSSFLGAQGWRRGRAEARHFWAGVYNVEIIIIRNWFRYPPRLSAAFTPFHSLTGSYSAASYIAGSPPRDVIHEKMPFPRVLELHRVSHSFNIFSGISSLGLCDRVSRRSDTQPAARRIRFRLDTCLHCRRGNFD